MDQWRPSGFSDLHQTSPTSTSPRTSEGQNLPMTEDPVAKIHDSEMPEHQVRRDPEDPFPEAKSGPDDRQERRRFNKHSVPDTKCCFPNVKNDAMAWTRQDPRNDKIGTDPKVQCAPA